MARRCCIGQVDRDLAILDAASGPGVLPLDPSGAIALLNVAGLVHHQDRSRVAQVPSDVIPQVIADRIGVPAGPAEQMLHPVRGEVPGMLGDRPAIARPAPPPPPPPKKNNKKKKNKCPIANAGCSCL